MSSKESREHLAPESPGPSSSSSIQTSPTTAAMSSASRLRLLDFDDLFLLTYLLEGSTIAATAKQLGLTQPAITQRVRKIERAFSEQILQKVGRHVRLTKVGRAICTKAADALALMRHVTAVGGPEALTIAADPVAMDSWLWPALSELQSAAPSAAGPEGLWSKAHSVSMHAQLAAPEDMLSLLESGSVNACLTARAPALGGSGAYVSLALGSEEYVFVAAPAVAAVVSSVTALQEQKFLELDKSYPLLSRLDAVTRAKIRFADVWFVASIGHVLAAAVQGLGVAILPAAVAALALQSGRLKVILPELDLTPETLRLIYRKESTPGAREGQMEKLAAHLRRQR